MSSMNNRIVSGVFWRFGEKITAQLVSFIVSVVLARILLPEDYGVVAIVNVFIAIAEIFVTSGLGTALIQKQNADELDFSTVFWVNITFSLLLYMVFFFLAPVIADFYKMPILVNVLRFFGIRLPISAFNSIQNAYVSRNMDFKKFFFATILGTIISAVAGVILALKGFGVYSLVIQTLTNATIDTIVLFTVIDWHPQFKFSFDRAKPLVSYGLKILATDFIGTAFNHINAFIIGKKYSSGDLAYYTQGKKLPDLINNNVGTTLSAVLFPAMALTGDKKQIKEIRRKSLQMLEFVMFPLMFGLIAVSDTLVVVLFTEKWLDIIPFIRIAAIDAIFGVLGTTLVQEIKAIGRSDVALKNELVKKPVFLVVILLAVPFGVKAIALSAVVNGLLAFGFNVYPVKKYIGFDIWLHIRDSLPAFFMSLIMCAIVYFLHFCIHNLYVCLVVQIFVGIAVYICLSLLTRNKSFFYLEKIFLNKLKYSQNEQVGKKKNAE